MKIEDLQLITEDVKLGKDVKIYAYVNIYGCEIGDNTKIGSFVEIQDTEVSRLKIAYLLGTMLRSLMINIHRQLMSKANCKQKKIGRWFRH